MAIDLALYAKNKIGIGFDRVYLNLDNEANRIKNCEWKSDIILET